MTAPHKALALQAEAPPSTPPAGLLRRWLAAFAWEPWALAAILLVAWQIAGNALAGEGNPLLPPPAVVFRALWDSLPELWRGTISSFLILLPGYGTALALGVALGLLSGTTPWLARAFFPFARVAAPIPPTVFIPYAIAVLPTFHLSATFVVFLGAFWPIFMNAASGAQAVEGRHRDNARVLGFSHFEYLYKVVFPASLPHIFAGMAVGLGFSFILLTVAELFGANAGLGRFVQYYADFADYPRMVAGILYTGAVTWAAMTLLDKLRHRALFWLR
ncbi:ABC transporter permease subunit [Pseudothauera nasutitermitis]|uniref:ABC transporter permease subunit n=1 Tax=Pseudothauera nasutitermitis TaxID=2565930 RepID=A0A4S4B3R3_9RHOO|nr:ABC transporter permease subunit [Pseudothauera nasutitermitis]THF67205.1 ABC transporter permease subunit [Pseudothauera nasutitermitis]